MFNMCLSRLADLLWIENYRTHCAVRLFGIQKALETAISHSQDFPL